MSGKLNVLVAYPYVTANMLAALAQLGDDCRWLVDSGAFTAWKGGKPIALDDYCAFLSGLPVKPWRYFALDVIGDPAATWRNYQAMLDRGFRPVPVFTRGESLDQLDRMFETSEVVGLGGVAGADMASYAWVKRVMQHAAGRKVHILGFTSMDWLKWGRPYSVDSSSWEQGARYGSATIYLGFGRFKKLDKAAARKRPDEQTIEAIRRLGFNPYRLQQREHWHGNDSLTRWICAASWIAASLDIERNLGTLLFLALAADRMDLLAGAWRAVTGRANGDELRAAALAKTKRAA